MISGKPEVLSFESSFTLHFLIYSHPTSPFAHTSSTHGSFISYSDIFLSSAAMYGNGVHFAIHASYSAKPTYSPPDPSGMRYMYLARVLAGDYAMGKQGLVVPPNKQNPNDPTETFDTVVDQIPNPAIFVTFYDWQCYPDYLITFR